MIRTLNDAGVQTGAAGSRHLDQRGRLALRAGDDGLGRVRRQFTLETALSARDAQGLSVRDELRAIGYAGADPVGGRPVNAYFEAHIEQGPILEHEEKVVGVVTGSLGLRWYDIIVTGMEMHAGPTPMPIRRDALLAASHLVQAVIGIANANQPHGRGTVGELHAHPARATSSPDRCA